MHDVAELPLEDDHKIDLTKNTCPTREERLETAINCYYGQMSQLIQETRERRVVQPERCFEQAGTCLLALNAQRIISIRDAVVLFHAPIGCSVGQHGTHELFRHIPVEQGRPQDLGYFHAVSTHLTEKDVVYGGGEKLKKALLEVERRYAPKAIFVLTSCASGIIGDDIEGAVGAVQPEIRARIVPCHTEGFRSRVAQTGYDAVWHAILKYLVKKPERKQADLINVTNMFSYTWMDKLELARLLGRLGLRVNFVPELSTIEELEVMSEAALTAPVCPTFADYLMKGLEQNFGVPYFRDPIPFGIAKTDGWLRKIAEYTRKEKEAEQLIEEEHRTWLPQIEALKRELEEIRKELVARGLKKDGEPLTAIGSVGQGRVLGHAAFLEELGMKIVGACTIDYDSLITDAFDALVKEVGDFVVLVSTFQAADYASLFHRLNPDLTLQAPFKGSVIKTAKAMGTIHYLRGDNHPLRTQAGYAGAVAYGSMIVRCFKNNALQKILGSLGGDPYQDWWYEADPLHFVKEKIEVPVGTTAHAHPHTHTHTHGGHSHA